MKNIKNKKADLDKVSGGGIRRFFKKHGRKMATGAGAVAGTAALLFANNKAGEAMGEFVGKETKSLLTPGRKKSK